MLHVFYLDVVKIDRYVAHVASRRGKQAQARAVPTKRRKAQQASSRGRRSECPGASSSVNLGHGPVLNHPNLCPSLNTARLVWHTESTRPSPDDSLQQHEHCSQRCHFYEHGLPNDPSQSNTVFPHKCTGRW